MGIGPIASLASGLVQSLFPSSTNNAASSSTSASSTSASTLPSDSNQLSPLGQILGSLQQLQQTNPSQYQQVTLQISNNLQTASQSATSSGNTALASELTQLSTDFKNASTSGQLPNVQDLAQAVGGGHHHHHHGGGGASAASSSSSTSATDPSSASIANPATTTAATGLSALLQSLTGTQNNSTLNPQSIILNTLSSAGVSIV
jgi:predicted secreted protein